jgi:hypothetical protein
MPAPPVPAPAIPSSPPAQPSSLELAPLHGGLAVVLLVAVLAAPLALVVWVVSSYLVALSRGEGIGTNDRRRLLSYLGLFLAVSVIGALRVVPNWGMQLDEERDFIFSAVCAAGKGCPVIGNEMNQLRIKLGPLARYLMTLCQLVTPDPRFTLSVILVLHALGAAWLAAAGDRLLGFPVGLGAGALFGFNPTLLYTIAAASNGAWSSFFLVGSVVGTLAWVRGEARAFVVAVTCAAVAVQSHGTNLVLLPPIALAWLCWRPPLPIATLALSAAIVGALYSPWLLYQWQSGGRDFSFASTAWMVSEGPALIDRFARIVPIMGGVIATFPAVAGMVAFATGGWQAVGRAVLLFLALPLSAALLAGGGWSSRYGVPAIVPGAIAAAAGICLLFRKRNFGRTAAAVIALVWLGGLLLESALVRYRPTALGAVELRLSLAEQIEAIRILGEHGFGTLDLETRVHGTAWDRWDGGQAYIGKWLIGTERRAAGAEHAVIVECERVASDFAAWQQRLTSSSRSLGHLLVGYSARLEPATVELVGPSGVLWKRQAGLPFYGQMVHGGDSQLRAIFDPKLAYPPEFGDLLLASKDASGAKMKISTRLAPAAEDRTIALLYDPGMRAVVTVGGAPRGSIEPAAAAGTSMRERFLVKASERLSDVAFEATIDLPAAMAPPHRVDLYEEPPCAASAAATRS